MYGNFQQDAHRALPFSDLPENHGYKAELLFSEQVLSVNVRSIISFQFKVSVDKAKCDSYYPGLLAIINLSPTSSLIYSIKVQITNLHTTEESNEVEMTLRVLNDRFITPPSFPPISLLKSLPLSGQIHHPYLYKTSSFFEVTELNKEQFDLISIDKGFTLFVGMELKISLDLFQAAKPIKCFVTHVSQLTDGKLKCSVKLSNGLPKSLVDQLNKYLMRYTSATPEKIRVAGLKVKSVKEFINYRLAETQSDYEAVLRTRRQAYSGVDKVDYNADLEKVSYFFDDYSEILMVMHNEEIIGSATMILGNGQEQPFEIQTFFEEGKIELPPAAETLEVAALCLHPDYRDTDILHGVFEQIYMFTLMQNKNYIIASSDKYLIKLYESIGFQKTPYRFIQPKYNDLPMEVLIIHRNAAIMAKGVKKLIWWPLWGTVNQYLNKRRVLTYSPYQKIKAGLLKRVFQLFFRLKYRRPWVD